MNNHLGEKPKLTKGFTEKRSTVEPRYDRFIRVACAKIDEVLTRAPRTTKNRKKSSLSTLHKMINKSDIQLILTDLESQEAYIY